MVLQLSPDKRKDNSLKEVLCADPGKVVALSSVKGGSGKTTVALCTATMLYYASAKATELGLREKPLSICLVDLDIRDGQIGLSIGQTAPTALDILKDGIPSAETIRDNLVFAEPLGIYTLLAPQRPRTADQLDPGFYQNVIEQLSYMFDVVILDTSANHTDTLLTKVAYPIADQIMFVVDLLSSSAKGMARWINEATTDVVQGGAGIPIENINVIINKSAQNLGINSELPSQTVAGADIVRAIPLDSSAVIAASNHRRLNDIILHHDLISPAYFDIINHLFPDEAFADPLVAETLGEATFHSGGVE